MSTQHQKIPRADSTRAIVLPLIVSRNSNYLPNIMDQRYVFREFKTSLSAASFSYGSKTVPTEYRPLRYVFVDLNETLGAILLHAETIILSYLLFTKPFFIL